MIITLCASVAFYQHVIEVEVKLRELGFDVIIPQTARRMAETGNFSVDQHKAWYRTGDYSLKTKLIDDHFKEIEKGDAILVINDTKHGLEGYIGGNVLMEMTIAHYLKKPIYILNPISEDLPIKEEVYGLNPIFLNGNLTKINTPSK